MRRAGRQPAGVLRELLLDVYKRQTLLFVSHDRYFINRFATRVWELSDGTINDYPMGFAQYRACLLYTSSGTGVCRALRQRGHQAILVDMFLGLESYTGRLADVFDLSLIHI